MGGCDQDGGSKDIYTVEFEVATCRDFEATADIFAPQALAPEAWSMYTAAVENMNSMGLRSEHVGELKQLADQVRRL